MQQQTATPLHLPVHYVVWRAANGGAELSVNHYIDHFSPRCPVYVYSLRGSGNEIYDGSNIRFQNGSDNNLECYRRYFRYCRQHRRDIFHLMNVGPVILLITLLAGVRRPVYHIHGTIYWEKTLVKIYLKTAWFLASLFRTIFIANSRYSASVFQKVVLPVQPRVIYNGFEVQKFVEKRSRRTVLRRMAYIGRLQPGKNVEMVIRLFKAVAAEYPKLELHIAGDGVLRTALERQVSQSPYRDRIRFHGWVTDIASFYGSVDLFVFLSAYESFGNVLPEALLTGLPVLTSQLPAFEEIYGGEAAFVLGNPERYDEIKEQFRKTLVDFPNLADKAFALSERMLQSFNIEHHLSEIENIYEQVESASHLLPLRGADIIRKMDTEIPDASARNV